MWMGLANCLPKKLQKMASDKHKYFHQKDKFITK